MNKFKIEYRGESKVIKRLCERVNNLVPLGESHDEAYYGDRGKEAYDHSKLISGNPHHVTAEDLGLGNVVARLDAIMYAIGMMRNWVTHENVQIVDHNGNDLAFHGVSADGISDDNYLLWH